MQNPTASKPNRIILIDIARGLAVIAMTIFHFSWDLEFFGYAPTGMTATFGWKFFARSIAASFLILSGISLILAHRETIRWQAFWRRFALVAGAAAIITISTFFATPDRFVFFGILHQLAIASLIALLILRLPALIILAVAAAWLVLPFVWRHEFFLTPALWWVGLAPYDPPSNDYVPVFPWTGFALLGVAFGKLMVQRSIEKTLANIQPTSKPTRVVAFLGRHSLLYYLVHQPIMMALLFGLTQIAPPDKSALFMPQCAASCGQERDAAFCQRFCTCVRQELVTQSIFQELLDGKRSVSTDPQVLDAAALCTASSEG